MKKYIKVISTIILIVMFVGILQNIALAATFVDMATVNGVLNETGAGGTTVSSARKIIGAIINVVKVISVGIAVIMLAVLAMKYMLAAPGDKADIKKHAVVYVVGAVVLFGASGILSIIHTPSFEK